ncbi:MAG: HIRAN domain-containing protein [Rugosibacter sp.]
MRSQLISILIILAIFASQIAHADTVRILVQSSPLAGFKYYAGEALWDELREGDALTLIREPDNTHDTKAIRVEWRGQKLGYLPRAQNQAVSGAMDAGERIDARIAKLRNRLPAQGNPWQRLLVDVFVVL